MFQRSLETRWGWVFTTWVLLSSSVALGQPTTATEVSRREIETALVEARHNDAISASDRLISERPQSWSAHQLWSRVRRICDRDPIAEAAGDPVRVAIARLPVDPARAAEEFRAVVNREPDSLLAHQGLLVLALERGELAAAEQALAALEGQTTDPALGVYRAQVAFAAGRVDRAHALAQSATRAAPDDPWARVVLIEIELHRNQPAAAEAALEELRFLANTAPETYRARVDVSLAFERYDAAESAAEAAALRYPNSPQMLALAARVALERDRFAQARRIALGSPETDRWKEHPGVWSTLVARAAWGLRDRDLLADAIENWPPDQPGRELNVGYLAYLDHDLERARSALTVLAGEDRDRLRSLVSVLEQEEEKQRQGSTFNGLLGAVIAVALLGIGLLVVLARRGDES